MSVRASTLAAPAACSGAMYSGVPMITLAPVRPPPVSSVNFEIPKSISLTSMRPGSGSCRNTFSGLRSRWMMPAACAAPSPISASRMINTASCGSIRPWLSSRSAKLCPRSISMTM